MHDQEKEPLNALVQTQLTTSARDHFRAEARRRHLNPSALLRVMIMEMLEEAGQGAKT